jgi:hypothetical protein
VDLRIGCAADIPLQRLQAFLGLLAERCAGVEPRIVHLTTGEQLRRMRDGDLELGLVHDPGPWAGIATERVYRGEEPAAVMALAHGLAGRGQMALQDLANYVLLVAQRLAEPGVHDRVLGLLAAEGTRSPGVREAPGADVRDLLFAAASGQGVALVAPSALHAVGRLGDAVTARPLVAGGRLPDTCVAWANGRALPFGVRAAARGVARELYAGATRSARSAAQRRPRRPCR